MTEAWGIAESQSPYGEASLATWLSFTPTPLEKSCRNPLTGKHLLQPNTNAGRGRPNQTVAIPLRGSISCNTEVVFATYNEMVSQSPYGEASLATSGVLGVPRLQNLPSLSQSPYGEASLATKEWKEYVRVVRDLSRNPLTGKHLLQLDAMRYVELDDYGKSQSPYGEASLATRLPRFLRPRKRFQSQSPYGEASLATGDVRVHILTRNQVAIPLRGSISCNTSSPAIRGLLVAEGRNPLTGKHLLQLFVAENVKGLLSASRNPLTGKHLLQPNERRLRRRWGSIARVAEESRNPLTGKHLLQPDARLYGGVHIIRARQSQSPYGEASLATRLITTAIGEVRTDVFDALRYAVAIPLRGSISCNQAHLLSSQSPYGEASLATATP
jgi:hypothetical protein